MHIKGQRNIMISTMINFISFIFFCRSASQKNHLVCTSEVLHPHFITVAENRIFQLSYGRNDDDPPWMDLDNSCLNQVAEHSGRYIKVLGLKIIIKLEGTDPANLDADVLANSVLQKITPECLKE